MASQSLNVPMPCVASRPAEPPWAAQAGEAGLRATHGKPVVERTQALRLPPGLPDRYISQRGYFKRHFGNEYICNILNISKISRKIVNNYWLFVAGLKPYIKVKDY